MKLSLTINGNKYDIDATSDGDSSYLVSFNGNKFDTTIKDSDGKSFNILIDDKNHEIELDGTASGSTFESTINGKKVQVELASGKKLKARKRSKVGNGAPSAASSVAATTEPGAIVAPMPGTVLAVDKKVGDAVKTGERILTIEAMKMENEIRAEKDGKVKEIRVKPGSAVMSHDVLAIIE